MKIKIELQPTLSKTKAEYYSVYFWYQSKRYRFSSGRVLGKDINPNHLELIKRHSEAVVLCSAFTMAIRDGWRPETVEKKKETVLLIDVAKEVLSKKLSLEYSQSYKKDLVRTEKVWTEYLKSNGLSKLKVNELSVELLSEFVRTKASSARSMHNVKRNISALLKDELESKGVVLNMRRIKLPKTGQELHRPIDDISTVLGDIKQYNDNLHLCCLMTYSMLLRPHREIRCLSFSDFNTDFTVLSLDGNRVKSKRNRIVPVPAVVRKEIVSRFETVENRNVNLFSMRRYEHNPSYFKGIWSKYKKQSELISKKQTLYSFRHTGAIKVFEKTGSLLKLQQVMGHSDMKVSLTYLRGLELKQLDVEDLPNL